VELARVKLRKVPGCIVLGLLAAMAAHAALYQHAMGGAYHALVLQIAQTAALGFVALVGALAWTQSESAPDGSVLAARLCERLPGVGSVVASAAALYLAIEAIEPHHAGAPVIALLGALAAASYVVLHLARAISGGFARAVFAISRKSFLPRAPAWRRRSRGRLIPRPSFVARRRFARAPPVAFAFSRA
jgi:hypothetical protein